MTVSEDAHPGAPAAEIIPALDGLRGMAILLVLVGHSLVTLWPVAPISNPVGKWLVRLMSGGWVGVDLFFVLSGFLITRILLSIRHDRYNLKVFYIRRVLRIFPLYLGFLALVFWVFPIFPEGRINVAFLSQAKWWLWFHVSNIGTVLYPDLQFSAGWLRLSHFWSLSVEEQFYLVWPFLVFLLQPRTLLGLCLAFPAVTFCARLWYAASPVPQGFVRALCHSDGLVVGVLIALLLVQWRVPLDRLARVARPLVVFCGLAIGLIFVAKRHFEAFDPLVEGPGVGLVQWFWAGVLVLSLVDGWWARLLNGEWLRLNGKYSYAMYVFHPVVYGLIAWWTGRLVPMPEMVSGRTVAALLMMAAAYGATYFLARLSWNYYESRFLALKVPYVRVSV